MSNNNKFSTEQAFKDIVSDILEMDKKKFQEILKKHKNGEIAELLRHGVF